MGIDNKEREIVRITKMKEDAISEKEKSI